MEKVHYIRNNVIFCQGDMANCMYAITSGCVGIYTDYGTPGVRMLAKLRDGQYFGEMAMFEGVERNATAIALSDRVSLEVITWQTLGEYFRDRPSNVVMILQQMGQRLREMDENYKGVCKGIAELVIKAQAENRPDEAARLLDHLGKYLDDGHEK